MAEVKQEFAQVGRLSWARVVRVRARVRVVVRRRVVCMFVALGW